MKKLHILPIFICHPYVGSWC